MGHLRNQSIRLNRVIFRVIGFPLSANVGRPEKSVSFGPLSPKLADFYSEHPVPLFEDDAEADSGESWHRRIRGLRPNSSTLSHEELDACDILDEGDVEEFGRLVAELRDRCHKTYFVLN